MNNAIEAVGLSKRFGKTVALDGLDLTVPEGTVHGFLGPNGSGKSTTIRVLLGLIRAEGGRASVLGGDPWRDAVALHRRIAYVPGDMSLWPNLTGRQAIDGDTAQVGPQVADFLGLPQVTYVFDIESVIEDRMIVKRRLEDGYERLECKLPALLTVIPGTKPPRYPVMAKLLAACRERAPIEFWNAADIRVTTSEVGLEGSLTQVMKTFAPKFERQSEILEGSTSEVVEKLITRFKDNKLV